MRCSCLLICLLASATWDCCCSQQAGATTIYIDPLNGIDAPTCLSSDASSSEHACESLGYAFSKEENFTTYILASNQSHNLTAEHTFANLQDLSFVGHNAIILCESDGVGLAFVNVSGVYLDGISLLYCAATRNSTSKDFYSHLDPKPMNTFKVGLYFYLCEHVVMTGISVSSSPGATGVVMYDTGGTNTVENCTFSNNTVAAGEAGGGGFYVEFTYCIPGDSNCSDFDNYFNILNTSYAFSDSKFYNNSANNKDSRNESTSYIIPYRSQHEAFGRGGGLSIFIKGMAANNSVSVDNCNFEENTAQWGGGAFVEFHDETGSNLVNFTQCKFVRNRCKYDLNRGTGGGGMRIGHYVYGLKQGYAPHEYGNRVELTNCLFVNNSAMYGGGLSISPTLQITDAGVGKEAIIMVTNSTFKHNIGRMGAAIHIGKFALITDGIMIDMVLRNCTFQGNSGLYATLIDKGNTPHIEGVGTVYINQVPTRFQMLTTFLGNSNSALAVVGTSVDFTNSSVLFFNNSGYRGGAISLLGAAYFLINDDTTMFFISNTAHDRGGAVYNRYVEMDNLMTRSNCFVRHTDPFKSPRNWAANFSFWSNTDQNGKHDNSIHTSSILPCAWAGGNDNIINDPTSIFCWNNWQYISRDRLPVPCKVQVTSEPGNMHFTVRHDNYDHLLGVKAIPGWTFKLPLAILDDYGTDTRDSVILSSIVETQNISNRYIWNNSAVVEGLEYSNTTLTLESLGDRIWQVTLAVELEPCPAGFALQGDSPVCVCAGKYSDAVFCDPDSHRVEMSDQHWMGKVHDNGEYLVSLCPPGFCRTSNTSYILLPATASATNLSAAVCSDGRKGILCGECVEGHGTSVNTLIYDCIPCNDTSMTSNVFKYLSSVYLPNVVLFFVIIMLDIRLTTGAANAFILYSQVITSTFSLDAEGQIQLNRISKSVGSLERMYKFVYGIFNLEFLENVIPPLCLTRSPSFNALSALSLDYGVAIFPLVVILLVLFGLKLKNCFRCTKCHRMCKTRTGSLSEAILPAFATFILLSYTKFSITSSYIMGIQPLIYANGSYEYTRRAYYAGQFPSNHEVYVRTYLFPSVLIFAFVCFIPLLLLVYPLRIFEWFLSKVGFLRKFYPVAKVHFFLDTFQGCFKNRMRFFSGLYFLFRLVLIVAYLATDSWLQQFVIQQIACIILIAMVAICRPYNAENDFCNYVDILVFTNLLILNSLSLYLLTSSRHNQAPPRLVFAVQYMLVYLPLLYMLAYVVWYFLRKSKCVKKLFQRPLRSKALYRQVVDIATPSKHASDTNENEDGLETLFERAESKNLYHRSKSTDESASDRSSRSADRDTSGRGTGTGSREKLLSDISQSRISHDIGSASYGTISDNSN